MNDSSHNVICVCYDFELHGSCLNSCLLCFCCFRIHIICILCALVLFCVKLRENNCVRVRSGDIISFLRFFCVCCSFGLSVR